MGRLAFTLRAERSEERAGEIIVIRQSRVDAASGSRSITPRAAHVGRRPWVGRHRRSASATSLLRRDVRDVVGADVVGAVVDGVPDAPHYLSIYLSIYIYLSIIDAPRPLRTLWAKL